MWERRLGQQHRLAVISSWNVVGDLQKANMIIEALTRQVELLQAVLQEIRSSQSAFEGECNDQAACPTEKRAKT